MDLKTHFRSEAMNHSFHVPQPRPRMVCPSSFCADPGCSYKHICEHCHQELDECFCIQQPKSAVIEDTATVCTRCGCDADVLYVLNIGLMCGPCSQKPQAVVRVA